MKFNVTKTNTMKRFVVNAEGNLIDINNPEKQILRFVDGTKDITEQDLARIEYRRLMEAQTDRKAQELQLMDNAQFEKIAYLSSGFGVLGFIVVASATTAFFTILFTYIL